MPSRDDLFSLIHSLTKAEKAWFKKFADINADGKNTNYMLLYDAIDQMNEYDEDKLKKSFSRKLNKQVTAEIFNYTHHYLHSLILKSLYNFHSDDTDYHRLHVWMNEISILFSKSLYNDCEKLLRRIKKIAKEQERFALLMHILPWQRKLVEAHAYRDLKDKDFKAMGKEELFVLKQHEQLIKLSQLSNELVYVQKRKGTPAKKTLHQFYDGTLKELNEDKPDFLSVKAEVQYHHILATIWFGKREFENALAHMSHMLGLYFLNPEIVRDEEQRLLGGLNNVLTLCVDLQRWNVFDDYLGRMNDLSTKEPYRGNANFQIRLFERLTAFQLRAFIDRGKIKDAVALIPVIENKISSWQNEMGAVHLIQIYFHLAIACVMNENIDEAHRWLRKLQTESDQNLRKDLHAYARIIELIIQFELGNTELLDSIVRSAERQFTQQSQLTQYEKVLFRFFRKELPSLTNKKEKQQGFKKLSTDHSKAMEQSENSAPVIEKMVESWCTLRSNVPNFS